VQDAFEAIGEVYQSDNTSDAAREWNKWREEVVEYAVKEKIIPALLQVRKGRQEARFCLRCFDGRGRGSGRGSGLVLMDKTRQATSHALSMGTILADTRVLGRGSSRRTHVDAHSIVVCVFFNVQAFVV
jgi:hypothetical protein